MESYNNTTNPESNNNELDNKILNTIENCILNRNSDILSLLRIIKEKILKITNKNNILNRVNSKLNNTKYYFLRHAISEHNIYRNRNITNPNLSENGKAQMMVIISKYIHLFQQLNYIFISPLKRTLTTFELLSSNFDHTKTEFIATDLLRERLGVKNTNIGMNLESLKNIYNNIKINFCYIKKSNWWIDNDWSTINNNINITEHQPEDNQSFHLRIKLFLLWTIFKCSGNVLIISHSKVYHYIVNKSKIGCGSIKTLSKEDIYNQIKKILEDDILI